MLRYVVLLCDGMADYPFEPLGMHTPMELAKKPCMNRLAACGEMGLVQTVPKGFSPGSDVANLSVMGYTPSLYYSGRSPLEAASIGIDLSDNDLALRCNFVTLSDEGCYSSKTILDYCAGDIETAEARELITFLKPHIECEVFRLYAGVSYRHCLVWKNGPSDKLKFTPPHDITGHVIEEYLSKEPNAAPLIEIMRKSYDLLPEHPINKARVASGKHPANAVWFWGEGKKKPLPPFQEQHGIKGTVVSAVDLVRGIGKLAGMDAPLIPGATGYIDTDFAAKYYAMMQAFEDGSDFVYLHIEAPDECGHRGEAENKIRSIELIDNEILNHLVEEMSRGEYRILVLPDHATPLSLRTHTSDPIPYLIYDSRDAGKEKTVCFSEKTAKESGQFFDCGEDLLSYFLKNK